LRGPASPLEFHSLRTSTAPSRGPQAAVAAVNAGGRFATAASTRGRFAATAAFPVGGPSRRDLDSRRRAGEGAESQRLEVSGRAAAH